MDQIGNNWKQVQVPTDRCRGPQNRRPVVKQPRVGDQERGQDLVLGSQLSQQPLKGVCEGGVILIPPPFGNNLYPSGQKIEKSISVQNLDEKPEEPDLVDLVIEIDTKINGMITENDKKKRAVPAKKWCFTLNNHEPNDKNTIIHICIAGKMQYIIGEEVGAQGTPHLQGYIESPIKIRPTERFNFTNRIHWEKARGSLEQNIEYCSKDGKFESNFKIKKPVKIIKELYPWQKSLEALVTSEPDDRSIYWIYEEKGGVGKTQFCKYLAMKYDAVPIEGKKNDILYCAAEFESDIYLFDLERSMEEFVSYSAIEKIKNGFYMCSKYESKPIIRNSPHVLIFANFKPEIKKLSKDRWNIYVIDDKKLVKKDK